MGSFYNKFLIIFAILILTFEFSFVNALLAPQVYFLKLNLKKDQFEPGEKIEGETTLWNYENYQLNDLMFSFQLLGGQDETGGFTQTIDKQIDKETFSLLPKEKLTRSFSYTLPKNLPKGVYTFRIQLINSRGEEMSWIDQLVKIGGEGKFLFLDNYWILKDDQKLNPGAGVYYQPGEIPKVIFDVKNETNFFITAFYKVITYKREANENPLKETKKEEISFSPREKKTLIENLELITEPNTYLSEIRFYSAKDQEPISNSIYFRWIVSGKDNAQILSVETNSKGDKVQVKIQYAGPADFRYEGGKGKLEIELLNEKGQSIGKAEREIELEPGEIKMEIPVEKSVSNPKVVAKISKDGKILDRYLSEFLGEIKKIEKEEFMEKESFLKKHKKSMLAFILVLIAGIVVYFIRFKKIRIFLLIFFLSFLGNQALAATEVTGGCCDTTIIFNSPAPDQTFQVGETITFSGKFKVTSCSNGLFFNKVVFYITEDKEIPITDCCGEATDNCTSSYNCKCDEGCKKCYGATSTNYSCSEFKWCDEVKYLKQNSGYKIYKLGEIFPPDVQKDSYVEYNTEFEIPENLDFSGKVRFYVQYSGTHWKEHWHWNITYQPGFIVNNKPPSAKDLKVTQPDYCSFGPGAIFSWKFEDPEGESQSAYQIQVATTSDFSSVVFDSGKVNSSSNSFATPEGMLSYNKTYYWRLRVWDNNPTYSAASSWISGPSFTTPRHPYPQVDFEWEPKEPHVGELVTFKDKSIAFGNAIRKFKGKPKDFDTVNAIKNWFWEFEGGDPATSSQKNPQTKFVSPGSKLIKLTVTDFDGYSCSGSKTIFVKIALPKWREIAP